MLFTPHHNPPRADHLPGVDGLRAVAVLAVIVCHLNAALLPGGFSGVDVFFVISGYVVSGSLAHSDHSSFRQLALRFYARRLLRIYPALVVCVMVTALAQTLIVPESWLSSTSSKTALAALFGLGNVALVWVNDSYFSPKIEFNAFTHTWSLGVEEQFYLLFPALYFFTVRWRGDNAVRNVMATRITLPGLLLLSLLWAAYESPAAPERAYYLLPSRLWELASGALLFNLHDQRKWLARSAAGRNACLAAGAVLLAIGFFAARPHAFPFPWALPTVAGTLLALTAVASHRENPSSGYRILDNRAAVYLGRISYSLYLWHWPILAMFRWTIGLEDAIAKASALTLTFIASVASYHLVEVPTRYGQLGASLPHHKLLTRGFAAVVACCAVTAVLFALQPQLSLSVTRDRHTWYPQAWPEATGSAARPLQNRQLFVLGNSHTGAYATLFGMIADREGVIVRPTLKTGCPIATLLDVPAPDCARYIDGLIKTTIAAARPGDVVFLASLRAPRLGDQWTTFDSAERETVLRKLHDPVERAAVIVAADNIIARFEQAGLVVMIDAPKPVFPSPPFRCTDWFNTPNPVCRAGFTVPRSVLQAQSEPVMTALVTLRQQHPKLVVWDLFPLLCPDRLCSAYDGKLPLFFDGDHLSAHGNRVLYPDFNRVLKTIWTPAKTG